MRENKPKAEKIVKKKGSGLFTKIILRIVTILVLVTLGLGGGYIAFKKFTTVKTENKLAMVDRQLSFCQELVTFKYRYSDIATVKKNSGFGKSYSLVKYTGIIRAGISDITDISYSVSIDGKTITLIVPQVEILGNEIVSQSVFDEKRSIFAPLDTQDVFDEINKAKSEALEDMLAEGLLQEARDYSLRIITQFMLALGFEDVQIK